jgi:predicted TIM-barrel fold metal-dependent hydrolase
MAIIDAHIHYGDDHPDLLALLDEFDLTLFNICVAHEQGEWRDWPNQAERYRLLTDRYPQRFGWCTTFDLPRFDDPEYVDKVIEGLDHDFAAGAVACKVWKNIGMEVKTPAGDFFMVDDPLFDPIFDHIAARGRTLLTHIAEPLACWQPLHEDNPHYGYYSRNPEWHMYNKPEFPSHARLMDARDHMIEKHPDLRIVGAHFGSLEYNVDEVAARLDRFPNFAVDISARLLDVALQDSDKVRQFFISYADRILFGTDVVMRTPPSQMDDETRAQAIQSLRETYQTHFAYFERGDEMTIRGRSTRGIALPADVLEKFYRTNAERWYPGLSARSS